ncbi:MAG: helix-turn-helix domain-containing protein [Comamonadaceae bacterium]|nr:helix-turn-helix domain-containing protein [Rubrivivax sp.]NLZ39921.1 helix-turn-helix domain-containing protein [Comamonadaceae bacterium]
MATRRPAGASDPAARAQYAALRSRDARFDGRLFVGVTSTGVYCRPVCRVRTPLARNCRFFASAALAERAGFRPCLRCRPERAPGLAWVDSSQALALVAARRLAQAALEGRALALPALAATLGVTDRHLRRIFAAAHGVSPLEYLTTQRLLHAKQLLADTALPVTQIALASGFASLRRFNAAFAERYRMAPTALRRAHGSAPREPALVVRLGYRPPYDVAGMLHFCARRAVAGVEAVAGDTLRRTLAMPHAGGVLAGWVACRFRPERHEIEVALAPVLAPVLAAVLQRVRRQLDVDADPALVDPVLAGLPGPAGVRVPGACDGFETAVRVILGQQVTVAAARTLAARLVEALGVSIATPFADLTRLFPDPARIAGAAPAQLGRLGIVRQRVRALQALAAEVQAGRLELHPAAPLGRTLEQLRALPGIGAWSVQMIALRALGWPDAFPAGDLGVLAALEPLLGAREPRAAEAASAAWRPWRAYAVLRLWHSLET